MPVVLYHRWWTTTKIITFSVKTHIFFPPSLYRFIKISRTLVISLSPCPFFWSEYSRIDSIVVAVHVRPLGHGPPLWNTASPFLSPAPSEMCLLLSVGEFNFRQKFGLCHPSVCSGRASAILLQRIQMSCSLHCTGWGTVLVVWDPPVVMQLLLGGTLSNAVSSNVVSFLVCDMDSRLLKHAVLSQCKLLVYFGLAYTLRIWTALFCLSKVTRNVSG